MELKGIDGGLYKWWSMWFNAIIRAKSYQSLIFKIKVLIVFNSFFKTGVAWLSSARVVRFLVNSFNERNSSL